VYVIREDATHIKFASSLANAVAGTAIDFTDDGTGSHTITHNLTARTLGQRLGEETHASTVLESAVHNHVITDPGHSHAQDGNTVLATGTSDPWVGSGVSSLGGSTGSAATGISLGDSGSSSAHNNMQPSVFLNVMIKL
jgi:microcystin-dependent protein